MGLGEELKVGQLSGLHLLLSQDIPTVLADRGHDGVHHPCLELLGRLQGGLGDQAIDITFGDDLDTLRAGG